MGLQKVLRFEEYAVHGGVSGMQLCIPSHRIPGITVHRPDAGGRWNDNQNIAQRLICINRTHLIILEACLQPWLSYFKRKVDNDHIF